MSIVAGVDFGTLSVRVSLFDKREGRLGSAVAEYPLNRSTYDPNFVTQSHAAQMGALAGAMRKALAESNISGDYASAEEAHTTYLPDQREASVYDKLIPDIGTYCFSRNSGHGSRITKACLADVT